MASQRHGVKVAQLEPSSFSHGMVVKGAGSSPNVGRDIVNVVGHMAAIQWFYRARAGPITCRKQEC